MRCGGSFGVTQVLVGLDRIGIVGLPEALKKADASGLGEREGVVDLLVETLSAGNFFPEAQRDKLRTALWREYLRHQGGDPSPFYSEIDVTVRGTAGEERDRFVQALREVLAGFDLRPIVHLAPESEEGENPQLAIAGDTVIQGTPPNRWSFESAIRRSFSGW